MLTFLKGLVTRQRRKGGGVSSASGSTKRKFPDFDPDQMGRAPKTKRVLVPLSYTANTKDWQKQFRKPVIVDDYK